MEVDPITHYQSLKLCWASKANCIQRAGRTGRVMNGRVFRLVPKAFYDVSNAYKFIYIHYSHNLYTLRRVSINIKDQNWSLNL